ncbi:COG1361 family protein [Halorussus litoreus]|uniref:hypothetical protein n=1 Tax=Halorussus litoreus TaxID=1710536 RepID=UPI000E24A4F0|nr:hypothetical protein [Halorussus litoreus]
MKSNAVALVVAVVVVGKIAGVVTVAAGAAQQEGTVVGRPNLELSATDNRFGAGEQATLDLFVSNNANFVRYGQNTQPEYNDGSQETTKYVILVVEDRPQFDIRTENATAVAAVDTATYRLDVTNDGTTPAIDAQLRLAAANSSVFLGSADAPRLGHDAVVEPVGDALVVECHVETPVVLLRPVR